MVTPAKGSSRSTQLTWRVSTAKTLTWAQRVIQLLICFSVFPSDGPSATAPRVQDLYSSYHFFAADDWKLTNTFTLNYGLR